VAQLVAALINAQLGAPVDAVGELSISHTPPSVKNFAIREFGSNDKTVLVWGIRVVLIIFAIVIGMLALRKLWQGMVGLAVFVAIGVYAAASQPTANAGDVLPTLVGGLVAALFLGRASTLAGRRSAQLPDQEPAAPDRGAAAGDRDTGPAAGDRDTGPTARDRDTDPAAGDQGIGDAGPQRPAAGPGSPAEGPGRPAPSTPDWQRWQPRADEPPAGPVRPAWAAGGPALAAGPDRRKFLLVSAGVTAGSLVTYTVGTWLAEHHDVTAAQQLIRFPRAAVQAPPLPPGYNLKIPGLSPYITPNANFYRVDTALVLPEVLPSTWQLRVHGMVDREIVLSYHDLLRRPLIEDYITLCCVSNPVGGPYVGNAKWLGASLRSVLREAGIKAGADQLLCTSADGFTSGTPVQTAMDGRDALLAVAMNGSPLPVEHGFPVRLVIPGLYGYVSACKWLVDIEVTTYRANVSYWAQRGWSAQAPIKTESRIDVPALGNGTIKAGQPTPIAGVAWAQHKGIEAVEVRIASGPWQPAKLATTPDIDSWRQWVYEWDVNVPPGNYMIEARATDKTGYTQTSLQEPPEPNGASGYPSVLVTVS
jgi:DMSO/TMAO reductase YedYZ molybdopterin-dependent catalytic subunit